MGSSVGFARAEDDPVPVGVISSIRADVFLCNAPACDEHGTKLDKDKDVGRILFDGETLFCKTGGDLRIDPGDRSIGCQPGHQALVPRPARPNPVRIERGMPKAADLALERYGRRAGRDKGSDSPIYSPADKGAAIPGKLVVRWRTRPALGKMSITLRGADGAEIARVDEVEGASGLLDSDALRKALVTYRDASGSSHEVQLVLKPENGPESVIGFSVLSSAQECELEAALKAIDSSHGLFGYVQRASILESAKLYDWEAAEYDAALKDAPMSRDMLRAALDANSRIGNSRRAKELRDKLYETDGKSGGH
jgi:hypothetical protein